MSMQGCENACMFLRSTNRTKDGKGHRYYSVVENRRVRDGRSVQKTLLYLGEINDSQKADWVNAIEVVEGNQRRQMALFPDDRVAPAGVANSVHLLMGELEPQQGHVKLGTRLEVLYFDQLRDRLDLDKTVQENVGEGSDTVTINGRPRHVIGYLQDFLFTPDRVRSPVRVLSGGERNRLLLARLFLEGANVVVLDEPTNDLDLVTLNVLERLLLEFDGSVLIVTHDRYFLDKVATSILAFEGDGRAVRYPGNYETYRRLREQSEAAPGEGADAGTAGRGAGGGPPVAAAARPGAEADAPRARRPGKLSFREQRELEGMEAALLAAEGRKAALEAALADPGTYRSDGARVPALRAELAVVAATVDRLYARWQELESLRAGG